MTTAIIQKRVERIAFLEVIHHNAPDKVQQADAKRKLTAEVAALHGMLIESEMLEESHV